jgi:Tfp pilus assembly protein PilN
MIRINLLPPEITQKRKDEQRWRWLVVGSVALFLVVGVVFAALQIQVTIRGQEVADIRQQALGLQAEAQRFQVFQLKETDLQNRSSIAATALSGRMDWSALFTEVALVMPSDTWARSMTSAEPNGTTPGSFVLAGAAIDYLYDVPDFGYKPIAKLLIRLAELPRLNNVWVGTMAKPAPPSTDSTVTQYIDFSVSASILSDATQTATTPGVPAPPANP